MGPLTLALVPDAPHLMVDTLRELFRVCITAGTPKWWLLHNSDYDNQGHDDVAGAIDGTGDISPLTPGLQKQMGQTNIYVLVEYAENQKGIDLRQASSVLVSLVSSDPFKPVTLGYGHVSRKTRLQIDIRCGDNPDPYQAIGETNWSAGTFTAGSTTTVLKDTVKFDTPNNTWQWYYIYLPTGERRLITASTQATTSVTVAALSVAPAAGSGYIIGPYELTGRHRLIQLISQIRNGLLAIRNLWDDTNGGSPTGYNKFGSNYLWLEIANPEVAPEKETNAWRYTMEVDLIHPFQAVPEGGIQDATN